MCTAMPVFSSHLFSYLLFSAVVLGTKKEVSTETAAAGFECTLKPSKYSKRDLCI